jgi:hypothetical protein
MRKKQLWVAVGMKKKASGLIVAGSFFYDI